jgi:DNA primase
MTDPDGTFRNIIGRATVHVEEGKKWMKLSREALKIPDTERNPIGGLFNAAALFDTTSPAVYLTEAVLDALTIMQVTGTRAAFSANGLSPAYDPAWLIPAGCPTRTLYICYDDDEAGRKAARAEKAKIEAATFGLVTVEILTPPAKDWNEAHTRGLSMADLTATIHEKRAARIPAQRVYPYHGTLNMDEAKPEPQAQAEPPNRAVILNDTVPTVSRQSRRDDVDLSDSIESPNGDPAKRSEAAGRLYDIADAFEGTANTEAQRRAIKEVKRLMMQYDGLDDAKAREWKRQLMSPCESQPLGHVGDLLDCATGKVPDYPEWIVGHDLFHAVKSVSEPGAMAA